MSDTWLKCLQGGAQLGQWSTVATLAHSSCDHIRVVELQTWQQRSSQIDYAKRQEVEASCILRPRLIN